MNQTTTAIVTGAGSGVGQAAAMLLAQAGYHVVLVARTASRLDDTAQRIREATQGRTGVLAVPADVADAAACERVARTALAEFGRIDALVNVAGHAPLGPIDDITPEQWRQVIDVNLSSVVYLTAAVWPAFRRQRSGVIVNTSSMASVDPFPGFSMYAAAKVGVNMFTLCTGREGAKIGVRAVAIAPGAVETPMLRANFSEQILPRGKTLDPMTVAALMRDCVTGARPFENGETILLPSP